MSAPSMVRTVHRTEVAGSSVRFVYSPAAAIDVPWVVATDVLRCIGAREDRLDVLLRELRCEAPVRMATVESAVLPLVPPWVLVLSVEAVFGLRAKAAAIRAMRHAHDAAHPGLSPLARTVVLLTSPSTMP